MASVGDVDISASPRGSRISFKMRKKTTKIHLGEREIVPTNFFGGKTERLGFGHESVFLVQPLEPKPPI